MYRALIVEDDRSIAKLIKEQAADVGIDCRMVDEFSGCTLQILQNISHTLSFWT